ncbi:hypothetical protein L484_001774 [Morus notabilis]|uniref:Uncharacterized protein n=1 Tax=Morus notabilis TaxID=981085 RepID=W9SJB8_9ROSA|nr:hypothetical protein L484_001774 [Morus notabilis]
MAMNSVKKKSNFSSATFRGLGCGAGSSQQVSKPALIRTLADWEGKKVRKKKQTQEFGRGVGGLDFQNKSFWVFFFIHSNLKLKFFKGYP